MNTFGNDFYPTPPDVAATMLDCLDLRGKVVLEPSAGSGNLVSACIERGADEVLTVEPDPKLRSILSDIPGSRLIGNDFLRLQPEEISHIDIICMNPPFSADEAHILHAWAIAPPGCEIVSLCNASIISNRYRKTRNQQEVCTLIEQYGNQENLGSVFEDAERTTQCEIGLVRLTKPGCKPGADEFDGFFLGPDDIEAEGYGIIKYRKSRDLVNRYIEACKIYDEQLEAGIRLKAQLEGIYKGELGIRISMDGCPAERNRFRKEIQKAFWKVVIDEMLPPGRATSQLQGDINRFVEQQTKVPFTERNIFKMLQIIMGTSEQRIDRAVEAAFNVLTKYTKENRCPVEGWATNEQYLFNEKFIIPYLVSPGWSGGGVRIEGYGATFDSIRDLIKALCFLTGREYEEVKDPDCGFHGIETGKWHNWGFFDFKCYKKGTGHFKFKNREDWAVLNARIAKIRGLVLPENVKPNKKKR